MHINLLCFLCSCACAHSEGKFYKAILKQFDILVGTIQNIIHNQQAQEVQYCYKGVPKTCQKNLQSGLQQPQDPNQGPYWNA